MKVTLLQIVLYLLAPFLLFLFFWFDVKYASVAIITMLLYVVQLIRNNPTPSESVSKKNHFFLVLISIFITYAIGLQGDLHQEIDVEGHYAKYNHLYYSKWPISMYGNFIPIVYYFGYYLVPVLFCKMLGILSIWPLIIWTALGIYLALKLMFLYFDGNYSKIFLLVFLSTFLLICKFTYPFIREIDYSAWNVFYGNLYLQFINVPNQAIVYVIILFVYFLSLRFEVNGAFILLIGLLSGIHSVFTVLMVGLIVLLHALFTKNYGYLQSIFLNKFNLLLIPSLLLLFIYFSSSNGLSSISFLFNNGHSFLRSAVIWSIQILPVLFINVMYVFYFPKKSKNFGFVLIVLFLGISFCKIGQWNDLVMRCLPVITLAILSILLLNLKPKISKTLLFIFCLDLIFNILIFKDKIESHRSLSKKDKSKIFNPNAYRTIEDYFSERGSETEIKQYSGRKDSFYYKYLIKKST